MNFKIIERASIDGCCPGYALFGVSNTDVVLVGNRALRRHPDKFMEAWSRIEAQVAEDYGWKPRRPEDIRWVTKGFSSRTMHTVTSFYEADEVVGLVEQDPDDMIVSSIDYKRPRTVAAYWIDPFWSLPNHWEDFAASLA